MLDKMKGDIFDIFITMFDNLTYGMLTLFNEGFLKIISDNTDPLNLPIIKNAIVYGKWVAILLLILKLMYELGTNYVALLNGESDENPFNYIKNGILTAFIILNIDWIINRIYNFGVLLAQDVISFSGYTYGTVAETALKRSASDDSFYKGLTETMTVTGGGFVFIFFFLMILIMIMLFVILVQMAIRRAELAYYQIVAPFLAINFASSNKDKWGILIKGVVILTVTQAVQLVLILMVFESFREFDSITSMVYSLGIVWVAFKTPNTLKQFVHSTGVTGAGAGAGRMIAQRMVFKAPSIVKK